MDTTATRYKVVGLAKIIESKSSNAFARLNKARLYSQRVILFEIS